MTRPWQRAQYAAACEPQPVARPPSVVAAPTRTGALAQEVVVTDTVAEPPYLMFPEKPCPCEEMEALLRILGEPESDSWLEHFAQENRSFIPWLHYLKMDEAAKQILSEHAIMTKQIKQYGSPDFRLLEAHAAFENKLAMELAPVITRLYQSGVRP